MVKMEELDEGEQWRLHMEHALRKSAQMLFVGVYSRDTCEPIAISGADNISVDRDHVRAIINHIRVPDNLLAQIKIVNLHFFCHTNGGRYMTGMSNFNQDNRPASLTEADKALFNLTRTHYTRQLSKEGYHAINVSAILNETVLIFGLCKAGTESSLKVLKDINEAKETSKTYEYDDAGCSDSNVDVEHIEGVRRTDGQTNAKLLSTNSKQSPRGGRKQPDELKSNTSQNEETHEQETTYFDAWKPPEGGSMQWHNTEANPDGVHAPDDKLELKPTSESDVKMRESSQEEQERRRNTLKRETSFCEDWRTATLRSIEALRKIGPFDADPTVDIHDDKERLIDDGDGCTAKEKRGSWKNKSPSKDKQDPNAERRASRSTLV